MHVRVNSFFKWYIIYMEKQKTYRLNVLGKIPRKVFLACSGGPDSMAVLDFLISGRKDVNVAHFNHGTEHGKDANMFLEEYCKNRNIPIQVGNISKKEKPKDQSWEEWWRNSRYEFFNSLEGTAPVITCHHLNDIAEWWIFTSLNGLPRLIPYKNGRVFRPFLGTKSAAFRTWCDRKDVPYVVDPSNTSLKFARSRIRNQIMPEALKINPGLLKVLKKKVENSFNEMY